MNGVQAGPSSLNFSSGKSTHILLQLFTFSHLFILLNRRWKSAVTEREAQAHTSARPTRGRSGSGSGRRRSMIMSYPHLAGTVGIGDFLTTIAQRQRAIARQSPTAARSLVPDIPLYAQPATLHSQSSSSTSQHVHHHPHPSVPLPAHDRSRPYPLSSRDARSQSIPQNTTPMMGPLVHDDRRQAQAPLVPSGAGRPQDFTPAGAATIPGFGWLSRGPPTPPDAPHWSTFAYDRSITHGGLAPSLPEALHHDSGGRVNRNAHPQIGSNDEVDPIEAQRQAQPSGVVNVLFGAVPPRIQAAPPPPQDTQAGPNHSSGHGHDPSAVYGYAPPFGSGHQQPYPHHHHHHHHYHHNHSGHGQQTVAASSTSHQQHQQLYRQHPHYPSQQQPRTQSQQTVMPMGAVGGPMPSDGRDRASWQSTVMTPTAAAQSASSLQRAGADALDRENVHPDSIGPGAISQQLDRPAIADGRHPPGFWGA
jgi:hypothetical protein